MTSADDWDHALSLNTERLELEPLRADHADEMAPLLDDAGLHSFIGGGPSTPEQLRDRYEHQVVGHSADGSERWLNWVVRRCEDGQAVGAVQATVSEPDGTLTAVVAWLTVTSQQRHGYAREASQRMVAWLEERGVAAVVAYVHPQHLASMAVARSIGLAPSYHRVDGEVRWEKRIHGGT